MSIMNTLDIPGVSHLDEMISFAQHCASLASIEERYSEVDRWETMEDKLRVARNFITAAHVVRELEAAP